MCSGRLERAAWRDARQGLARGRRLLGLALPARSPASPGWPLPAASRPILAERVSMSTSDPQGRRWRRRWRGLACWGRRLRALKPRVARARPRELLWTLYIVPGGITDVLVRGVIAQRTSTSSRDIKFSPRRPRSPVDSNPFILAAAVNVRCRGAPFHRCIPYPSPLHPNRSLLETQPQAKDASLLGIQRLSFCRAFFFLPSRAVSGAVKLASFVRALYIYIIRRGSGG